MGAGASPTANTKYVYLNISVWYNHAASESGSWDASAYDTWIQFYASDWNLKEYYAPTAAAAPTALDEPAAAQALAASAAAAFAIAAALY